MQVRKVLVPMDFSPPSKLAVDYGVALARSFRAKLTLMHVVEMPAPHEIEEAELNLSTLVGAEDEGDLDIRTIVKTGDVQDRILETVREQNADLVVMGTHGRGFLGRALVGSVTQNLLRKLDLPVLTVCHATGPLKFSRIFFAADFSNASESAFRVALDLAGSHQSHLTIFHVMDYPDLDYGVVEADFTAGGKLMERAKSRLKEMAAVAKDEGVDVETMVAHGRVAEQVVERSRSDDLILLSIERKGVLERALSGTTAEYVIRESHIPVFLIPANAAESGTGRTRRAA